MVNATSSRTIKQNTNKKEKAAYDINYADDLLILWNIFQLCYSSFLKFLPRINDFFFVTPATLCSSSSCFVSLLVLSTLLFLYVEAFFDMYIGDLPVSLRAKEEITQNVADLIRKCWKQSLSSSRNAISGSVLQRREASVIEDLDRHQSYRRFRSMYIWTLVDRHICEFKAADGVTKEKGKEEKEMKIEKSKKPPSFFIWIGFCMPQETK